MQLTTMIKLGFATITGLMLVTSAVSIKGSKTIAHEIDAIANYQIPLNNLVMETQKDILKEEILTYEIILASKEKGEEFEALSHKIKKLEKETNSKLTHVQKLVSEAKQHVDGNKELEAKYEWIHNQFKKIGKSQKEFIADIHKFYKSVESNQVEELSKDKEALKHVLVTMDKEIVLTSKKIEHLLKTSTTSAEEHETSMMMTNIILNAIAFILAFGLAFFISNYFNRKFKKPIEKLEYFMSNTITQKDISQQMKIEGNNEISTIGKNLNQLMQFFQELIDSAKTSANENASISHELSTTSYQVGTNVENTAHIIDETTSQAKDVLGEVQVTVEKINQNREDIQKASQNLNQAKNEIIKLTSQVQKSAEVELELSENMQSLSNEAGQVKGVLSIIGDIAEQTNLLALNAAIEAARAGEHGRGFAVVADEVRQLAEKTQKSLIEINATINVIVQAILDASDKMIKNSSDTQELSNTADTVEQMIGMATNLVEDATKATKESVEDFEKTGENVKTMVQKIEEINNISSSSARSVEEIAAASEHLSKMTEELNIQLETFRT